MERTKQWGQDEGLLYGPVPDSDCRPLSRGAANFMHRSSDSAGRGRGGGEEDSLSAPPPFVRPVRAGRELPQWSPLVRPAVLALAAVAGILGIFLAGLGAHCAVPRLGSAVPLSRKGWRA